MTNSLFKISDFPKVWPIHFFKVSEFRKVWQIHFLKFPSFGKCDKLTFWSFRVSESMANSLFEVFEFRKAWQTHFLKVFEFWKVWQIQKCHHLQCLHLFVDCLYFDNVKLIGFKYSKVTIGMYEEWRKIRYAVWVMGLKCDISFGVWGWDAMSFYKYLICVLLIMLIK